MSHSNTRFIICFFLLLGFLARPLLSFADEAEPLTLIGESTETTNDITADKLIEKINENIKARATLEAQAKEADSTPTLDDPNRLSALSCEALIARSQDKNFSLRGLAGIRAHKNCKAFKFNFDLLSSLEKKIYAEEIDELDSTKPAPVSSLSVAALKKKLTQSKTNVEKFSTYKSLRLKQRSQGLRNDYLKTTAELYNWTKKEFKSAQSSTTTDQYNEATQILSRTYWTEGRITQAEKILNDSIRQLKGVTSIADLYFILGRMHEERESFDQAVKTYRLAEEDFKKMKPKKALFTLDRILWLEGWILYKTSKWGDAEKAFAELAKTTTDLSEKSRAQFYQARCLNRMDKKDEAKSLLQKITQEDFFGYYGLVSYYELGEKLPALSKIKYEKKFPFSASLDFLNPEEKTLFQDLIKFQEINLAERSIIYLTSASEKQINLSIYLAQNTSRYLPLFAAYSKLPNEHKVELLLTHADLIYPQPYEAKVKEMAEKTKLPSSLIYAIMKQESAFNPNAKSSANAMGLMQVIPRLASHLAKKFSLNYTKSSDLLNPEINIPLGSYELMEQVRRQNGQLTYVAAAYNAGPNALAGWLKRKAKNTDTLEFIEDIPYEETRTYVKLIARNKLFYDRISNRDTEIAFPSEFLTEKNLP